MCKTICHRSLPNLGSRRKGAILIIAIGVLTLLAILGATFANLMRIERQATENFIQAQELDVLNDSIVDRVVAELRGAGNWRGFTPYQATWLYKLVSEDGLAHGRLDNDFRRYDFRSTPDSDPELNRPWQVLAEKGGHRYRFKHKVIDTAAQININGKQDTLGRMLDNLAVAIERSPRLGQNHNPLWTGPKNSGELLKGRQIIEFRNKLEGNRFRSKTQLMSLIGRENFDIIKDFITVESYVDPYTYKPEDGIDEIDQLESQFGGGGGRSLGGGGNQGFHMANVESIKSQINPEPRSPVNINTAPEEVLIACLAGLGARRPFAYSKLNYAPIDQGATSGGGQVPIGREERDAVGGGNSTIPRAVWVYSDALGIGIDYPKARSIAQRIIAQRKQIPFMAWSTGSRNTGGFAEFVNQLEDDFFPLPSNAYVVDPRLPPNNKRIDSDVRGGGSPEMSRVWNKGHEPLTRSIRQTTGLPFSNRNAFYYDMLRGALIANANPNTRINRYNPNAPAYLAVDKSDLVRLDRDGQTPRKAHTTEFCFDSNGIYEITTLAGIAENIGSGSGGEKIFRSLYQKPQRTVVKIFEVLRHTNQFHFERTFVAGDRSSRNSRRYVQTCPDPMVALTDAVTAGSKRDGYIQLAGFGDARRNLLPPDARFNLYKSPATITMAHGFHDRDDASYAQLRRMNASGTFGNEYSRELWKVFGAHYSLKGAKRYTEMYTREELSSLGIDNRLITVAPALGREGLQGTDLYPDGFHQSLFTATHLEGRFIAIPAHERIGFSTFKSGNARQVGAGPRLNINANVPYYNGGMAFWVKFDFDGDDPVFSGLIGCTSVIEDVGLNLEASEGTQFYIFKNTEGQLRIVRMYYHQAFPGDTGGGDGSGGGDTTGAIALWPDVSEGGGDGGPSLSSPGENPLIEHLDPKKIVARTDYIIDVRRFRAHEWHHIAVDWNDTFNPSQALQLHIDFERVQGGGPFVRHDATSEPSAWVRLNCRRPKDELFIGGFLRNQQVADAGVFKWFTTFTNTTGASRGVRPIEFSLKRILANATIDELITYDGTFPGVRSYYGPGGAQGYFTNQTGEYANVFRVPMPPEVDYVILRSLDWTSYYPSSFTTRDGQPHRVITPPIVVQISSGRENIPPFQETWRPNLMAIPNPVAGRRLARRQISGLIGANAELVYSFKIPSGKVQSGPLAGGSVHTPIIDDVTLTYFLPTPKILLQEEAEESIISFDY